MMKKGMVIILIFIAFVACACNLDIKNEQFNEDKNPETNIKEYDLSFIENKITNIANRVIGSIFYVKNKLSRNKKITCRLFSIHIPENLKELYEVKTEKDCILIYDKQSKKSGFGGFAFGIKAYKTPAEHAMSPGVRKLGELTDKKGELYDIVLIQPTDVQYDYTKEKHDSYSILYNLGETVDINGVKGAVFYKNQGMKGQNLYEDVLNKHITAIREKWDSQKLEQENLSYMYYILAYRGTNVLDKVGYAFYDVNGDGIDELLIGEIAEGDWKGVIYDIYTMVNRKPAHVVSGGSRNRYFVSDDTFLCNEYSSGAAESGWLIYILVENSTELYPQVGFKYDGYEDKDNPWFISYNFKDDKWENVSEQKFKERKSVFDRYQRFDFVPLSKIKAVK